MKKFIRTNILNIIVLILFSFMTIGYALYGENLGLNGKVYIEKSGIIEITEVTLVEDECTNLASHSTPEFNGMQIKLSLTGTERTFTATYLIEITNNSFYDYTFTDFAFNPTIEGTTNTAKITTTITNDKTKQPVGPGDSFPKTSVTILKVKIEITTNEAGTNVDISGNGAMSENNVGSMNAIISATEGNLQGENAIECYTLKVMNTYNYTRNFYLVSSNENIRLVDRNKNDLSTFTINGGATTDYDVCTIVADGSIFLHDTTTTIISLYSNGISKIDLDEMTFAVDIDLNATDDEAPTVGNVLLSISETSPVNGEATLTWSRIDSAGTPVINYHIILYNETTQEETTYSTGNAVTSYTFTGLTAGTYSAKVYGEDEADNIGFDACENADTSEGYCSATESTALKWVFSVDYSGLNNLEYEGSTEANIYQTYETTLSLSSSVAGSNYSLPSSITVKMDGVTLTSGTDYTYSSSSGKVVINKVTGDLAISGSASWFCLIKGTKVRLADGTYKNIEEIGYDDLLAVYNHEDGGVIYEYPIWIEHETKVNHYQKTTFSDGTVLKTFGPHGIFSMDALKYVSVTDKKLFDIGTRVAKINKDGSIKIVKVSKIEIIYENTSYYHVSSTRFHNIITEDILTTDGSIITSNMFSFDENIVWTEERDKFLKTNDLFVYEDWKNFFPEHIFKGYRMAEAKHIFNQGLLDIEMYYLNLKDLGTDTIKDSEGNNLWMVTTSDDIVINKSKFLRKQNDYYVLPKPLKKENFIGWYNTADGKMYNPNEKIRIIYGMHFVAKYSK